MEIFDKVNLVEVYTSSKVSQMAKIEFKLNSKVRMWFYFFSCSNGPVVTSFFRGKENCEFRFLDSVHQFLFFFGEIFWIKCLIRLHKIILKLENDLFSLKIAIKWFCLGKWKLSKILICNNEKSFSHKIHFHF